MQELVDFIQQNHNEKILLNHQIIPGIYTVDIYLPDKQMAFDYNLDTLHSTQNISDTQYHYKKMKALREQGIHLIQIWEHQWNNELFNYQIKAIILNHLGKSPNRVYARNTIVKPVDKQTAKEFCIKEHLQGWCSAKELVVYGLYDKKTDELLQLSSFGRYSRNGRATNLKTTYDWNWVRGCISSNNAVIGGTSKLLSHFIKDKCPESILCYSDANIFDGRGYSKAGFELDGYTGKDKFYIDKSNNKRINRSASRYSEYMQNVKDGKWLLCYGAGSLRFVWRKENNEENK